MVVVEVLELELGIVGGLLQRDQFAGQPRRPVGWLPTAACVLFCGSGRCLDGRRWRLDRQGREIGLRRRGVHGARGGGRLAGGTVAAGAARGSRFPFVRQAPPVYAFFGRWRDTGLVAELHDLLREVVREAEGRGACRSRRPPRPAGTPPLISVLQS
ncbi:hypothetical protein [Streptomyces sp. NPDC058451]|uniref:hypothetical protein n=1 Tax=Streptomyces sp. NPDC058451 TaxID=3346506 RepID=UPI0036471853